MTKLFKFFKRQFLDILEDKLSEMEIIRNDFEGEYEDDSDEILNNTLMNFECSGPAQSFFVDAIERDTQKEFYSMVDAIYHECEII